MSEYMHNLIEQLVEEALYEAGPALEGTKLRNAMADVWANKEMFSIETIASLPEQLRKYYLKTRRDTKLLGQGSSRYVYKIGSDKVIKMAIGARGMAQNKAEADAELCGHGKYYAEVYEHADDYSWIVSELAMPVSKEELEDLLGTDLESLEEALMSLIDQAKGVSEDDQFEPEYKSYKRLRRSSWLRGLMAMVEKCDLEPADITKPDSWGVRKNGKPILIDYGMGASVYDDHYAGNEE